MKLREPLRLFVATLALFTCGGLIHAAPSEDMGPKALLGKIADAAEGLVASLEQANSAEAVVAAFDGYSDALKNVAPKWKAVIQKQPELKGKIGMKEVEVPAELEKEFDRITAAGDKMWDAMKKVEPHAEDEAVQKAQQRFSETIASLE